MVEVSWQLNELYYIYLYIYIYIEKQMSHIWVELSSWIFILKELQHITFISDYCALYYYTKTPIDCWYRQKLNIRSPIQSLETY